MFPLVKWLKKGEVSIHDLNIFARKKMGDLPLEATKLTLFISIINLAQRKIRQPDFVQNFIRSQLTAFNISMLISAKNQTAQMHVLTSTV